MPELSAQIRQYLVGDVHTVRSLGVETEESQDYKSGDVADQEMSP
jgi:hypothetical protein